ncbi:MAG: dTDP-4-dehydrorhamnose 3,5-epimerase family protein [Phycisphaerae bacterium]|jgi:dTDP-4-dehydrorhamnose 3,5-epimerase|nr:dTDP-4-dehydrorhamnose 3,5-epimerase family protein [Phycisphaerae bacterium]
MIDGVRVMKLKPIPDERGRLMEIFRSDEPDFEKFGQVYITTAYPGVVKAWHYHKKQTDNFCCIVGMMKIALYDAREDSPTNGAVNEFFMGVHNPIRLRIPAGVYHGFKCISEGEAIVVNTPTEPYNHAQPDEYRVDAHLPDIPYDWGRKDR